MKRKKKQYLSLSWITIILIVISCLFQRCNSNTNKQTLDTNKFKINRIQYTDVELISLVSNPKRYNGKPVRIKGFLKLAFEGNIVYSSKQEYNKGNDSCRLWIDITRKQMDSTYRIYNKSYVTIEGVFDTTKRHMGMLKGAITKIKKIESIGGLSK